MGWYRKTFISSLGESVIFSGVAAVIGFGGLAALQIPFFDGFGFALLVLSSGLMLVGGALSFATPGTAKVLSLLTGKKVDQTTQDFEKAQHRAALYATTGVILFVESLALAAMTIASA